MLSLLISILATILGCAIGLGLAIAARKVKGPVGDSLESATKICNVLLLAVYAMASPIIWFLGLVSEAYQEGFWGVIGWVIAAVIWIAPLFFGLGLGLSVWLRKKGRSVAAFVIQFAGVMAIAASFLLYAIFVGSLLTPLN